MTVKEFNVKYQEKGGIIQLTNMRDNYATLLHIGTHFGVSKECIRLWMIDMFGIPYDPKIKRREKKVASLRELIRIHGLKKTRELYPGINRSYLKEAAKNL